MKRLFLLSLALLPLGLSGCQKKQGEQTTQQTQGGGQVVTQPPTQASAGDELLTAALANPATASRQACVLLPGLGSEKLIDQDSYGLRLQAAAQTGYAEVTEKPFHFAFTQKYKDLLAHSSNPQAANTRLCLGAARVQQVRVTQQVNPDKVIAEGVTQVHYEPWATEEVRQVFGPGRNDPMFQPIQMVCTRNGNWSCEKR